MLSLALAGLLLAGSGAGQSRVVPCSDGGVFVVRATESPDGPIFTLTLPDGRLLVRLEGDVATLYAPKPETLSRNELLARYPGGPCELARAAAGK
ncbi:MAG TPA: hypothetical protein VGV13_14315 [Methylomirabilota bacterium]|jgi:hypothetical protein|nr:hypothetical protein [Methylomirabilota bacterium]